MEFGLSPIPGFLFLCPFLRFGSARTQFPAAPNFFIFSPSSSGVSAALLFLPSCSFSFPSCSFSFWAAVFLLRCPVPCCLFPLPSFLVSFPVRPLPARPLSSRPLPRVPSFPHAFFSRLLSRALSFPRALFPARLFLHALFPACPLSRALSFRALFPARPLPRAPSFPCGLFPRSLSRAPSFPHAFFSRLLSRALSFPCALFPARSLSRAPLPVRSLSRALSFPCALFPVRSLSRAPSFRASRTYLPRLHSSRLEPSPQLEHSPTGTSAERNGSGWNGSKWGSNVCAIVFGASTGPSRAVYVTKLLNIFRILLKYLHNSKRPRTFAVKF